MTKLFTGSGDEGMTDYLGEGRIPKYDLRIDCVGSVDEATSAIGLARASSQIEQVKTWLLEIQRELYSMMAELAASPENAQKFSRIGADTITRIEDLINDIQTKISLPHEFIIPGDNVASASLDLARVSVRRAERRVSELASQGEVVNPHILSYLNRLSSLCFALELYEIQHTGQAQPTLAKKKTTQ